jgi:hypothetical protein
MAGLETAVVGWQPALDPLQFWTVPRPLALLIGSLAVVVIGLAAVRVRPAWHALGAVVLAAGLSWLAVARPQILTVVLFAGQPGAAVLIAVLVVRWLSQRRYRRHVLFLPGFVRTAGGHSNAAVPVGTAVVRNGAAPSRVRREPSTIDAPTSQAGHSGRQG